MNSSANPSPDPHSPTATERLDSWKEIAVYLKRSVRTVTRWEAEQGLPVHRHATGAVYAYRTELDDWWIRNGAQAAPATQPTANGENVAVAPVVPGRRKFRISAVALILLAITLLAAFVLRLEPDPEPVLLPLTTYPGIEGPPSLSPDGSQVAFHKNGDIFVKQVDGEARVQLTASTDNEAAPSWSPDGGYIAFVRNDRGIFLIAPLGGGERKVADTRVPPLNYMKLMAWTADSRSLIINELITPITTALFRVSIETGEKQQLTRPSPTGIGDRWPAISPDGQMLAFARFPQDSFPDIYVMPATGGEPRHIINEQGNPWGLTWTPNGKEIVFACYRNGVNQLWRVPVSSFRGNTPRLVAGAGPDAKFPSFAHTGSPPRMAYQRFEFNSDIRRAEIVGEGTPQHALGPSSPFLASTADEGEPSYSPDGRRIAFMSARSGRFEIWLCNSDGSNLVPLTSRKVLIPVAPRWSPDGRQIAFFAPTGPDGVYRNYVVDSSGGVPRLLTGSPPQTGRRYVDAKPSWSSDGQWIYYGSGRDGSRNIWKIPSAGGTPRRLSRNEGMEALESPGGGQVYFARVPEGGPGIWSMPAEGGEEVHILDAPFFGYWAVVRRGIYFIDFHVGPNSPRPIRFYNFETRQTVQIGAVETDVLLEGVHGFAVSPDSRWLLYTSVESRTADLMLLENFR